MRRIQIYPSIEGVHTAYNSVIKNPPKGYVFIGNKRNKKIRFLENIRHIKILKSAYHIFLKIFPTTKVIDSLSTGEDLEEADLIYSTGHLYYGKKPWVLNILDSPFCLGRNDYSLFVKNKEKIKRILEMKSCKKIICAHETSFNFMSKEFGKKIRDKLILIRPALSISNIKRRKDNKKRKTTILFVGSINNPKDFYVKGGLEVIKTFEKIQEKEKKIELVMRCFIPKEIKDIIMKDNKIRIIEKEVSRKKLDELYLNSDILFLPSHQYVLMAVLEAMSFSIPILTINTYAVKDYVINGKTGLVVKKSDKNKLYESKEYPTNTRSEEFMIAIKKDDPELIERLKDNLIRLIRDKKLRKRLGDNGRENLKKRFSINVQRDKLKKVFDHALES